MLKTTINPLFVVNMICQDLEDNQQEVNTNNVGRELFNMRFINRNFNRHDALDVGFSVLTGDHELTWCLKHIIESRKNLSGVSRNDFGR